MKSPKWVMVFLCLLMCLSIVSFGQSGRRDRNNGREACFFTDADFRGDSFCLQAGESRREVPPGFNDRISSIRVLGGATAVVFKDRNFRGGKMEFRRDVRDLSRVRNANDRISSVRVR